MKRGRSMSAAPAERRKGEEGFTIAETLVALFVFALAGVALIRMQTQSVETYSRVETRALAAIVAENQLIDAMAMRNAPAIGARDGELDLGGRHWRWRLDVLPTDDPATVRLQASAFVPGEQSASATVSAYRIIGGAQ